MRLPAPRRHNSPSKERKPRGKRRSLFILIFMALVVLSPMGVASADPILNTNPNDACTPADHPSPVQYGAGIDGMVKPPDYPSDQLKKTPAEKLTPYDRFGTSGQTWYAVDMRCSDAMSMVGNSVSNVVFTLAKAFDRTTITIYQAAASESLLGWLKKTVDKVIHGIGNTFGAKYWGWVVILGAIWLAWWGLVRRRASKVAEGTIWMVMAMVALIWLINRPGDFTTLGTKVSDAATTAFNAALPQSDATGTTCIPNSQNPPPQPAQNDAVTRNSNGLWVTLVCKPWLMGEFGTDDSRSKIVQQNAAKLLSSQTVDLNETYAGQKPDTGKKSDDYKAVTKNIKENYPGVYSLYQGKDWTSRLAVSFGALLASLVAGLLILVIAVMLMILKIAFLLLLVAGPIFLGIGIHPGIGRVIAMRWFELLLSTLLKQAALIGVLALLLWCYGLVMAESLPWGLQILLISLVTLAAFIYRKPFQHLFAAVGYSAVNSRKSEEHLDQSVQEVRKRTRAVATAVVPGAAGYRFARGGKRDQTGLASVPDEPRDLDLGTRDPSDPGNGAPAGVAGAGGVIDRRGRGTKAAAGPRGSAPPLNLSPRSPATPSGGRVTTGRSSGGVPPVPAAREERRPSAPGGGGAPSSPAGGGPGWAGGGRGGGGGGSRPPASGGRGRSGGGRSDRPEPPRGSGGGRGDRPEPSRGSGGGRAAPKNSSQPAPKRADSGSGGSKQAPPPLWGGKSSEDGPAMPFWLRPVKRDDEQ